MNGHFGKFDDAVSSMLTFERGTPQFHLLQQIALRALHDGQRFYMPEASHVIDGGKVDEHMKSLIRLPFDCTCALSEQVINNDVDKGDGSKSPSWKITIAFDSSGDFVEKTGFAKRSLIKDRGFFVLSLLRDPRGNVWRLFPGAVFVRLPEEKPGYSIELVECGFDYGQMEEHGLSVAHWFNDDVLSMFNLCAMLNLANVRTSIIQPPVKLNKKRAANSNRPLLSYRVLTVDGLEWHGPSVVSDKNGVRSHLRRGHIRRISDDRSVWVRAAYVRGSVPGFVSKDYRVVNPPQGSMQ